MKIVWMIVAVLCGVIAIVFMLRRTFDVAFVVAAVGAVAWFLNYRVQARRATVERELQRDEEHIGLDDET